MIDESSRGSSCGSPASHTRECQVVNRVGAVQAKSGFRSVQYLQARVVWSSANHGCTPRRFCATQFVYRAEANPIQPAHRQGGFPDRCRPEDGRFENAPQHRPDSARLDCTPASRNEAQAGRADRRCAFAGSSSVQAEPNSGCLARNVSVGTVQCAFVSCDAEGFMQLAFAGLSVQRCVTVARSLEGVSA